MTDPNATASDTGHDLSLPCHRAEDLMEGGHAAHISLGDQLYTLRITRAGKLILTK